MTNFNTLAEQAAEILGNDGMANLNLVSDACARVGLDRIETRDDRVRYLLTDGSAIVVQAHTAWDVEGDEPFSWDNE